MEQIRASSNGSKHCHRSAGLIAELLQLQCSVSPRSHALRCTLQEANLVRFFDRKVRQIFSSMYKHTRTSTPACPHPCSTSAWLGGMWVQAPSSCRTSTACMATMPTSSLRASTRPQRWSRPWAQAPTAFRVRTGRHAPIGGYAILPGTVPELCCPCAGVTLNRNLFETALRYLLVDSAEYTVQLFEGSGSHWKKTRYIIFLSPIQVCTVQTIAMGHITAPVGDTFQAGPLLKAYQTCVLRTCQLRRNAIHQHLRRTAFAICVQS